MLGINVTSNKVTTIAIKNGISGFTISDTDIFATPAPTNNIVPTVEYRALYKGLAP